jgi:hypothetical protein
MAAPDNPGIPAAVIPQLRDHLAAFVQAEPDALVFPGPKGGPLRRSNFNKLTGWPHAVRSIGEARTRWPFDYADSTTPLVRPNPLEKSPSRPMNHDQRCSDLA